MYNQKKQEFITIFMDENDETIDKPETIIDKRARIKVALRFESIFVGSKVALQVRVNDVLISKWIEAYQAKPLILRRKPQEKSPTKNIKVSNKSEDESDLNSSSSEDEEDEGDEEAKPGKRVVKTVNF
jgi:hypothetical protein